jgi:hypothetical protein
MPDDACKVQPMHNCCLNFTQSHCTTICQQINIYFVTITVNPSDLHSILQYDII